MNQPSGTNQNEITTAEDLKAMIDSEIEYAYEMGISIEDVND